MHRTCRDVNTICQQNGGRLVSINTIEERENLFKVIWDHLPFPFFVGLQSTAADLPFMYRLLPQWYDGTIAYHQRVYGYSDYPGECGAVIFDVAIQLVNSTGSFLMHALCELDDPGSQEADDPDSWRNNRTFSTIHLEDPDQHFPAGRFVVCPEKHVTHSFLTCSAASSCWANDDVIYPVGPDEWDELSFSSCANRTSRPPSFQCTSGTQRVAYTLVCDFKSHCQDNSDEDFCQQPTEATKSLSCGISKEVFSIRSWCDLHPVCRNHADEAECTETYRAMFSNISTLPPPALVQLWGNGTASFTKLAQHGLAAQCPPTHFQCPGIDYCLPVFVRCNGLYDCGSWQDEQGCDSYTCPGFYRCFQSSVCVHFEHLCDSVSQCPQGDDESICDLACPEACVCHGLAFTCFMLFSPKSFPSLRYLSAAGSGLSPGQLTLNKQLVYLSLAACNVTDIGELILPNLHFLDLRNNLLHSVNGSHLVHLRHLKVLVLAGNPLIPGVFSEPPPHESVQGLFHLDLSNIYIPVLLPSIVRPFPSLRTLNLSGSQVEHLKTESMESVLNLRYLDLHFCPVHYMSRRLFKALINLKELRASSFRLCCSKLFSGNFHLDHCLAPRDVVSSCDSLIGQKDVQVVLILLTVLCALGNSLALVSHLFASKLLFRGALGILLVNLCVSDLFMGLYLAIIGVADRVFRGSYLWEERTWKESRFCRITGVLYHLSSEVSVFFVFLITLERLIELSWSSNRVRFKVSYAHVLAVISWFCGVLHASMSVLSHTTHSQFVKSSGLCVPLPLMQNESGDSDYTFVISITFHFCLFLMMATVQIRVHSIIQENRLSFARQSTLCVWGNMNMVRRVLNVGAVKLFCRLLTDIVACLVHYSMPIAAIKLNKGGLYTMLMPASSALDPLLYAWNIFLEGQRKLRVDRLLQRLKARSLEAKREKE